MIGLYLLVLPVVFTTQDVCLQHKWTSGKVYGEVQHFKVERVPLKDKDGRPQWLRPEVIPSFLDLIEAANKDGFNIELNSAHRTPKHQRKLWLRMPDIAAHPDRGGERTHQTGYSVDISGTLKSFTHKYIKQWQKRHHRKMDVRHCDKRSWGYRCPTTLYWWLKRNAIRFGFENDVESEHWHWTYTKEHYE